MLKKILIALVVIIAAFLVIVAIQPWEAWSPWAKLDPAAKVTFEGPDAGQGAAMGWSGNEKVGEGKMTIVESRPNDDIKIKVDFIKPFEGSIGSEFGFKPGGDKTDVTWAMTGHRSFAQKTFCLVMNGDKMLAGDIEKGLAQLKTVAESGKSASNS